MLPRRTADPATALALAKLEEVEIALAAGLDVIQRPAVDHGGFAFGLDDLPLPTQRLLWRRWLAQSAEPRELRAQFREGA